jgi:hypothetical protein
MGSLMDEALSAAAERAFASGSNPMGMLAGFDVVSDELVRTAQEHTVEALRFVSEGKDVHAVITGVFMSGFLTALHFERLRRDACACVNCGGRASWLSGRIEAKDGSVVHVCSGECAGEFLSERAA